MWRVRIFVPHDLAGPFREAISLATRINLARLAIAEVVDKLSSDLSTLSLVAAYGVVEPIAVIIDDGNDVRARFTALQSYEALQKALTVLAEQ